MSEGILTIVAWAVLACLTAPAPAQLGDGKTADVAERFPEPPKDYDQTRDGIDRGKLELVEYDSSTVGVKRKALVLCHHLIYGFGPIDKALVTCLSRTPYGFGSVSRQP